MGLSSMGASKMLQGQGHLMGASLQGLSQECLEMYVLEQVQHMHPGITYWLKC